MRHWDHRPNRRGPRSRKRRLWVRSPSYDDAWLPLQGVLDNVPDRNLRDPGHPGTREA